MSPSTAELKMPLKNTIAAIAAKAKMLIKAQ